MKFVCNQCEAKYSISDQKVRNKVLKIRCKKCSNVIVIRDPATQQGTSGSVAKPQKTNGRHEQVALSSTNGSFPKKNASQISIAEALNDEPQRAERTVIARISMDWLRRYEEAKSERPTWFLALGQNPYGPVVIGEVLSRIRNGEVSAQTLVWQAGWPDWVTASSIPELRSSFFTQRQASGVASALASADQEIDSAVDSLGGFGAESAFESAFDGLEEQSETTTIRRSPLLEMQEQRAREEEQKRQAEIAQPENPSQGIFGGDPFASESESPSPFSSGNVWGSSPNNTNSLSADAKQGHSLSAKSAPGGLGMASSEVANSTSSPQQDMPFPSPFPMGDIGVQQPTSGQDVADEKKALPVGIEFFEANRGDSQPSMDGIGGGLEDDFFKLGEGNYHMHHVGTQDVVDIELPPLPPAEEEYEEYDIDDEDIIAIQSMKSKWSIRLGLLAFLLLAVGAVAAWPYLQRAPLENEQAQKVVFHKHKRVVRKLTAAEKKLQEQLLGGGNLDPRAQLAKLLREKEKLAKKKRLAIKRRPKVRRRTLVASAKGPKKVATVSAPIGPTAEELMMQRLIRRAKERIEKAEGRRGTKSSIQPRGRKRDPQRELKNRLVKEVNSNNSSVKYCYEQYLRKITVAGRVVFRLRIEPNGRVSRAAVLTRRFRGHPITRCIKRRIKRWRFSVFEGKAISLQVPYKFNPAY